MTLRKKLLGGLAALIVIGALIVAGISVTTKPTFTVSTNGENGRSTFPVECHAIGPGQLNGSGGIDGSVNLDAQQIFESMSQEDLETYADDYGSSWGVPPGEGELKAQLIRVQENTSYYCTQLRENRQTGLMLTFGLSLLLLTSVGVAAILTAPRQDLIEKEKDGPHV